MHLIPYLGQNVSHAYAQNLIWRDASVFIMDNHRAAAWCWAQVVPSTDNFSIFHIDRHTDLLQSRLAEWCAATPPIETLTIDQYLSHSFALDSTSTIELFDWQNYQSVFIKQREAQLRRYYYLWHEVGDKPWFPAKGFEFHEAPKNLAAWLRTGEWIVNVDLDYFFTCVGNDVFVQILSDAYIAAMGGQLKAARANQNIRCLTIAISPEMCGGWPQGLRALRIFCESLGVGMPQL